MEQIISGVIQFQQNEFPKRKELFKKLATGQEPQALFITCADSRVDPGLITQADPGDLFICRNAGNIVPPHSTHTGGMTASIEYAVGVLGIPDIVICGHTDCGAMKGAMNVDGLTELPHVCEWLNHSRAAVKVVDELHRDLDEDTRLHHLIEQNVLLQMQHIGTHPYVAAKLAAGKVRLHAWVYDIETGGVRAFNSDTQQFEPLTPEEADQVVHHANATDQAV